MLNIALVIPLNQWIRFSKYVQGNIRIVKPKDWDGEVILTVLPDLGEDLVDFNQYETPTLNLTLLEALQK